MASNDPCFLTVTRLDLVTGKNDEMSLLWLDYKRLFHLADVVSCSDRQGYLGGL